MLYSITAYTDENGKTLNQVIISGKVFFFELSDAERKALMLPLVKEHELYCDEDLDVLKDYLWLEACSVVICPSYPMPKNHSHLYDKAWALGL